MPRPKKNATLKSDSELLSAIRFCATVSKDIGAPFETHVALINNWAICNNGVVAMGHPIKEDIRANPNTKLLIEALARVGEGYNITQLDENNISIKGNKFKAVVPCLPENSMSITWPDQDIANVDDEFKIGATLVGELASNNGQRVTDASILMNGKSVIATNGVMILEYWHGIDLPSGIPLPKAFVTSIEKIGKKLIRFGFSNNSASFYFEDRSWIKTQLYADKWPIERVYDVFDLQADYKNIPKELFEGLAAVMPFCEDSGLVYFSSEGIQSHNFEGVGASYSVPGMPAASPMAADQLELLRPFVKQIDFFAKLKNGQPCVAFHGGNVRGVIAGRKN